MSNPRKNSYGYTIRIQTDHDLSQFRDITIFCSASSNGGFALNLSASTAFIGNSTTHARDEGMTLLSGQWIWGQNLTAQAFTTADTWKAWVVASATGQHIISPVVTFDVDP
jgi:hypothetical protein